ncbi:hypothetical protein BMF89_21360 [Arthrobacter sp. SRS-W-1-2016]|uniref:hypothetical protein n=1 Tax=Arthrobacter sp. SRS-W-1-2016 TaxID=1930254 RepID=UPI000990FA85|nr:hypothetical protein [Arthrobacter sp. SRS-W-1-2016]OOP59221.1 hypothetical protein BMF89_21360 [Arthrobacter sp. SRS-W-1-2016]
MQKRLFLVDGMSGVWKATIVRQLTEALVETTVVSKCSTRPARPGENEIYSDLKLVTDREFDMLAPDFTYSYAGHRYGVCVRDIEAAFKSHDLVFVIVRNASLIHKLQERFAKYRPVSIFVFMDADVIRQRTEVAHEQAIAMSVEDARLDYLRTPGTYDDVIVYCDDDQAFYRTLDAHIDRYTKGNRAEYVARKKSGNVILFSSRKWRTLLRAAFGVAIAAGCGALFAVPGFRESELKIVALIFCGFVFLLGAWGQYFLAQHWDDIDRHR